MRNIPLNTLIEIVHLYGTPTYAYDLRCLNRQVEKLKTYLPNEVGLLYSLKANPSLGLCSFFASRGLGADVASAGELVTAIEAGFDPAKIFVGGPDKSTEVLSQLSRISEAVVSVDSVSELQTIASYIEDAGSS